MSIKKSINFAFRTNIYLKMHCIIVSKIIPAGVRENSTEDRQAYLMHRSNLLKHSSLALTSNCAVRSTYLRDSRVCLNSGFPDREKVIM